MNTGKQVSKISNLTSEQNNFTSSGKRNTLVVLLYEYLQFKRVVDGRLFV